jgi:hypothetical protein
LLDLDAIQARAAAATPGDHWFADLEPEDQLSYEVWAAQDPDEESSNGVVTEFGCKKADAYFIAAARADIPALVAELRAARADLGLVHLALQHDRDCEEEGEGECCLSHWRSIVIAVAPDLARNVTGQELADLAAFRAVVGEA